MTPRFSDALRDFRSAESAHEKAQLAFYDARDTYNSAREAKALAEAEVETTSQAWHAFKTALTVALEEEELR